MKCPKCNINLTAGRLLNNGMMWTGNEKYLGKDFIKTNVMVDEAIPPYGILAFRCQSCNEVFLYTSEDEKLKRE